MPLLGAKTSTAKTNLPVQSVLDSSILLDIAERRLPVRAAR